MRGSELGVYEDGESVVHGANFAFISGVQRLYEQICFMSVNEREEGKYTGLHVTQTSRSKLLDLIDPYRECLNELPFSFTVFIWPGP